MRLLIRALRAALRHRAGVLCSLAFLAACGTDPERVRQEVEDYEQMPHVLFEACLPDDRVIFERRQIDEAYLSDPRVLRDPSDRNRLPKMPRTVDWVEIGDGAAQFSIPEVVLEETTRFSDGRQQLDLAGSAAIGQPVYRSTIRGEAILQDYLAVGLWEPRKVGAKEGKAVYWFKLPSNVSTKAFGSWQSPDWVSNSSDMTFWKLMHGRALDRRPVPPGAPRLRFMLMSASEFGARSRLWWLSRYAAGVQYAKDRKFLDGYRVAPVTGETIPGC